MARHPTCLGGDPGDRKLFQLGKMGGAPRRAVVSRLSLGRSWRTRGLLLGVVVLAVIAMVAWLLLSARSELSNGLDEMRQAQDLTSSSAIEQAPRPTLDRMLARVSAAQIDFHTAASRLSLLAPALHALGWLPGIGPEAAASPDAAHMGDQTASGLVDLLLAARPAEDTLSAPHGRRPSLEALLASVARGHHGFVAGCSLLTAAQTTRRSLNAYHSDALNARLQTFDSHLPTLLSLCHGLALLPAIMGFRRPVTYLLAYQNNEELRATGGFIGSFGLITLHRGKFSQQFQSSSLLDNLSVPPPEPVQLYNGEPGWLFRDSNWSPDFPTSAALERFFLKLDVHRTVDGVIDVTPQAAADILHATGRIYLPEYRRWVDESNVIDLTDHYTHHAQDAGPRQLKNKDTQRKQFLAIVAQHVFARLHSLSATQLLRLRDALQGAIEHRDVLLNFTNPQAESLAARLSAAGRIDPTTSDYLYVVDSNLSYNKINPWVHIDQRYAVTIGANRWLQASLTLRFHNAPAPANVFAAGNGFGPGAGRLGGPDDYADFVRIYVPAGASIISQSGWYQPWTSGAAYGKTMFSGYLIVSRGQTRTVRIHYIVPPNVFTWSGGGRYRLLVQHQPGSNVDRLEVTVHHDTTASARWKITRPDVDVRETVPIRSLPLAPIPLSEAPHSVVAPGHWIEPHAYLAAPH